MMNNNMNKQNNKQVKECPIPELREALRKQAMTLDSQLSRSVARRTTCDDIPCVEYNDEVRTQYRLAEMLLYTQRCRYVLELCMEKGGATYRCRWADGTVTVTRFKKVGINRVKVTGLLMPEEKSAA